MKGVRKDNTMKTDLQEVQNIDCDEKVAVTADLEVEELEAVIAPIRKGYNLGD